MSMFRRSEDLGKLKVGSPLTRRAAGTPTPQGELPLPPGKVVPTPKR